MRNRGEEFERALLQSAPPNVFLHKLRTPAPPPGTAAAVASWARSQGAPPFVDAFLTRSRFTPRSPYDFLLAAPHPGRPVELPGFGVVPPAILFAMELKSVDTSLPFDAVDDHQEEGLLAARQAGLFAGLLIEFRAGFSPATPPPPVVGERPTPRTAGEPYVEGIAVYVPIGAYTSYKLGAMRKSYPLAAALAAGVPLYRDAERGRSRTYWRVADFLITFGAAVDPTPARPTRRDLPMPVTRGGIA